MARFRATEKGYYNDVIHDPETDHHVLFDAPDDFECSWAVKVSGAEAKVALDPVAEVSQETAKAEAQLDTESEAAAPVVNAEVSPDDAEAEDDIPADIDDDVETL